MTATARYIVRRERSIPSDRLLRRAAQEADAAGLAWELVVAVPPPSLGISRDRKVETLVVGDRAAQRHGLRVRWGRWNEREQSLKLDDGHTFDVAGRGTSRGGDAH
jgi:hypothetical protein